MHIPDPFVTQGGSSFTAIEAFSLLLLWMRSGQDLYDIVQNYDCLLAAVSKVLNELLGFLDARWSHLLGLDTDGILHQNQLQSYADATYNASVRATLRPTVFQA